MRFSRIDLCFGGKLDLVLYFSCASDCAADS